MFQNVAPPLTRWEELRDAALLAPETTSVAGCDLPSYFADGGDVRYVRPSGASTGDAGGLTNTDEGAWAVAEFLTHQGTLAAGSRVIFTGTFTGTSVACTANDLLLDCRNATITQGSALSSWTASGAEYKVTGASVGNNGFTCLTEDYIRMEGWSATGAGADTGRLALTAVDTTNEWVTLTTGYELVNGDKIALVTGTLTGVSVNTLYYVVDAQTFASSSQAVGLSLTPGGSKIDLTAAGAGSRFFFSDFSGRHSIPVAGSLMPGQWAYVPWEDAVYMRPSTGVPADHVYYIHQISTTTGAVALTGQRTIVLGGFFHTNARGVVLIDTGAVGSGFIGSKVWSGEQGVQIQGGATGAVGHFLEVGYVSNHAWGSSVVGDAESNQRLSWFWAHDCATNVGDFGDWQGVVTNPQSNGCMWTNVILDGIGRPVLSADVPTTTAANSGGFVIDSSSDNVVAYCYTRMVYGEQIEFGPNDVQSCLRNRIHSNVFDLRGLEPNEAAPQRVVSLLINAAANSFGADATNVIHNNLILLGENFGQHDTGSQDSGVFCIRVSTANNGPARQLTVKNNIIFCETTADDSAVFSLRRTNASYTHGSFVSDGNVFVGVQHIGMSIDGTGSWPDATGRTDSDTLAAWQSASSQDAASLDAITEVGDLGQILPGSNLIEAGVFASYSVDLGGIQYWNPPVIGPYEYVRPRASATQRVSASSRSAR